MNIIQTNPTESGSRPPIQNWRGGVLPGGYSIVAEDCDTFAFYEYNSFVTFKPDASNTVRSMTANVEAWEAWQASTPEPQAEPMGINRAMSILTLPSLGVEVDAETLAEAQACVVSVSEVEVTPEASGGWKAGEWVTVGTVRTHNGADYECIQPHCTQTDWTPNITPTLWRVKEAEGETEWQAGVYYPVGEVRSYSGTNYKCRQAHTSQVGWEPPNVPALWEVVA